MFESFFIYGTEPLYAETGTYQIPLVVLSYVVACLASYTALSLAQQLVNAQSKIGKRLFLWGGAFAMGAGIWSMHFIGMLSYKMQMKMEYDPALTLLSLLIAIIFAYGVLRIVARRRFTLQKLLIGSVLLGLGICSMHYSGMAAMKMDSDLRYVPSLFLLSVVIAIVASGGALWFAFTLSRQSNQYNYLFQCGAALIMGAAICGMHYTGMSAAVFLPWAQCRYDPTQTFDVLAYSIASITTLVLGLALVVGSYKKSQTEFLLYNSETKLRAMINNALDAVIFMDQDGKVTEWNKQAEVIFGWSYNEVIDKCLADIIIPREYREAHLAGMLRFINEGVGPILNKRIEMSALNKKGVRFPIELTVTAKKIQGVYSFSAFVRDITERKQSEGTKGILAAIVASSTSAIISKDLDDVITSWNAGAEKLYGYSAEEVIGKNANIIIPPDKKEEEELILIQLRKGENIENYETVRMHKDGRRIDVLFSISAIYDKAGRVIGVSKITHDISKRKILEEELFKQVEWFQTTLASIGDAVIAVDMDSNITFLNRVAEKMTGWKLVDAVGRSLKEIFYIINEETRLPTENPVDKVIQKGRIEGLANHTLLISKNGTEYSIEDTAAPIKLPNGKLMGVVLVFHDIGERRALENKLREKAEILLEKDHRKDEFLATLSHELRNPLSPISNALHVLGSPSVSKKMQKEALSIANHQVSHMSRLLDDLMDISRITYGKIILQRQQLNLCEIVQTAIYTAMPFINSRSHTLETNLPTHPVWVHGDATRLSQLLGNLLNNAAKYTYNGGKICLDVLVEGKEIIIKLKDNGIGIPKDKLSYIFDIFIQGDNAMERAQGGLGIGLMLVKGIAKLHEGSVEVHSEGNGKGTEFIVRLPIMDNVAEKLSVTTKQKQQAHPAASYRILVVDDNKDSAKTLGWMLEALGHKVKTVYDADNALKTAHSYKPEVILLDIGMPDMDGYELCKVMHKDPALKNTVFIAQTGWGQEKHFSLSEEAGFDFHLVKPINMETLQEKLDMLREVVAV